MSADTDASLYHNVFRAAPDPIVVYEPETGVVLDANPAACSLVGFDSDELVGSQVGSFSADDPIAAIERAAAQGSVRVDWSVRGPDGDRRRVDVTLERETIDGECRVIAFFGDISERRKREHESTERAEELWTVLDNLPVVVFALDPDGTFTYSAGKGLTSLGLGPGEVVGETVFDVYDDHPEICEAASRALDGNEVRTTQPVGDLVFETWYRPVFEDGGLAKVVGVGRNVTELQRREQRVDALSEATNDLLYTHTEAAVAERVTAIAEQIIDRHIAAMWSYDADEDVLSPIGATERALDFAGVDIPKELPKITPGADEKAIFDAGEPTVIEDYSELEAPSAPGVPLGTLLCLPLNDDGLLCVGSTTVEAFSETERHLLDILSSTAAAALERVARETELRQQRAALEQSNEALRRHREQIEFFNSILRHDILNGMNVIRARAELLEGEGQQAGYADTIVEWSDDIIGLTRKVRSVLRTLSDDGTDETEPVELAPVVESAAERATSMARATTVDISVHGDVAVTANDLLEDVFGNILTNAVEHGSTDTSELDDATEEGTAGNRRGSDDGPGVSVEVTSSVDEETVRVTIADDGPGVAATVEERIFERGEKGRESGGTGFGLYFVKAMIESYGGRIWVDESDVGATFVVELPREE